MLGVSAIGCSCSELTSGDEICSHTSAPGSGEASRRSEGEPLRERGRAAGDDGRCRSLGSRDGSGDYPPPNTGSHWTFVYHHGAVIMRRATVAVGWRLLK